MTDKLDILLPDPKKANGGKKAFPMRPPKRSTLEVLFAEQLAAAGLDGYVEEHVFHPVRKWRLDFAWVDQMLGVEVEGQGRHQSFIGFENDAVKYDEAALHGWTILRGSTRMVKDGRLLGFVQRYFAAEARS